MLNGWVPRWSDVLNWSTWSWSTWRPFGLRKHQPASGTPHATLNWATFHNFNHDLKSKVYLLNFLRYGSFLVGEKLSRRCYTWKISVIPTRRDPTRTTIQRWIILIFRFVFWSRRFVFWSRSRSPRSTVIQCFFSVNKYIEETGLVHVTFLNGHENRSESKPLIDAFYNQRNYEQFLYQEWLRGWQKLNRLPQRHSRMLVPDQIFLKRQQFVPGNWLQVHFVN